MDLSALKSFPPALIAAIALFLAIFVQVIMALGNKGIAAVLHRGKDSGTVEDRFDKARAAVNIVLSLGVLAIVLVVIGMRGDFVSKGDPGSANARSVYALELGLTPTISALQSLVWDESCRDSTFHVRLISAIAQLKGFLLEDAYSRVSCVRSEGISVIRYKVDTWFDGPKYWAKQEFMLRLSSGRVHRLEVPIIRSMQLRSATDLGTGIEVTGRSVGGEWVSIPNAVKTFGQDKNNACYVSCDLRGFGREGDSVEVTVWFRDEQPAPFSLGDTDIRAFLGEIDTLRVCYHFLQLPSVVEVGQLSLVPVPAVSFRYWSDGVGGWRSRRGLALPWPDDFSGSGWSNRDQILFEYARTRPSVAETPILSFWQERQRPDSLLSSTITSAKRYH